MRPRHAHTIPMGSAPCALLVPLLLGLSISACARGSGRFVSPSRRDYTASVQVGELLRTYLVHVPTAYDGRSALPVVLCFHGGGGTGAGMNAVTHFNTVADQHGFLVVYPDGYQKHWSDGRGTAPSDRDGIDDLAFVTAMLDQLEATMKVDTSRIYATGISNGGFFSARLGCELASRIAAIGIVAATMSTNEAAACAPSRPVAMMLIHGTDDPIVPATGGEVTLGLGGSVLSVEETIAKWVALIGCSSAPQTSELPHLNDDDTRIQQRTYAGCTGGSAVVAYIVAGGGHTWPGGLQYQPEAAIGKTSRDMDASAVLWDFFAQHPME